ncbi:DUF4097 family beta strand repeat-containing protein [Aquimarina sp. 2201CG5-10]|uniref:DUF4097 family beta strand repeat-containing protein n=1 Tax=Aquimarina callyspongiae TaxID=3098150 RepID=UPI002AB3FB8E|nr:DUF4097 family beta strand repeat-containing protein [Aquimarina sp. 2201CG5-10]MDY8135231.1 DUF4097 family beta strand repeat-containing protein [Aquimarina sp. 2201CG5-10]
MKNIAIALVLLLTIGSLKAQEDYVQSLQGVKKVKVHSESGVEIKAHDKNEVLIVGGNRKMPEKARGLKAVYAGGSDNTGFGVYAFKEGETLILKNLKNMHSKTLQVFLPKNVNISIERSNLGSIEISGFSSEIEATTNVGNITFRDVTGPIVAKTATGEINVVFNKVSQSSPISLISATGAIDVSLPSNTPANLELKTTMGEIFTDFDIKFPKEDNNMKILVGKRTIATELNNGGVEISLRSSTGNIYLRKQ